MKKGIIKTLVTFLLGGLLWVSMLSTGMAQQLKIGYVDVVRLKKEYRSLWKRRQNTKS